MSNNPPRLPSHRPASLAHLPAHDHSGWRPLGSGPFLDIPSLSNLPILDGYASIALSQPASPLVGPVEAPNRRLVRRRNAERNLRGAASPRSNRSATPFPRDNNVPHPEPPPAAAQAPAADPAPAPAPAPQVEWAGNPPAPNRIASDVARAADERHLLRLKQSLTDRFLCYHTSIDTLLYWDRDQRRPLWRRMPIPLYQGEWPGHPPVQPGEELDAVFSYQQALDEDEESRQQATQSVRGLLHRLRRIHRNRSRPRNHDDDGGGGGGRRPTPDRLTTKLVGKFQPAGIQFKRRLGQGGFGAVFLFEMVGEKGVIHPVVVKGSTRELRDGPDAFSGELENINSMNGASHFIQRIFLQDLPFPAASKRRILRLAARKGMAAVRRVFKPRLGGNRFQPVGNRPPTPIPGLRQPQRQAIAAPEIRLTNLPNTPSIPGYTSQEVEAMQQQRFRLDNARDIIVLENMPRGDIGDLINKLVKRKMTLSNRALWTIFECLFKGCVAMAMPGRFHDEAGLEGGPGGGPHAMVEQDESVPVWLHDGTRAPPRPMVHFDLDPQNALVGNFGEPGGPHENAPIIKVADPGLSVIIDDNKRNDEFFLWSSRCRGKTQYLLPEQFTHEWEYRAALDLAHLRHEPTAGNYSYWSNLYQIGWIMWSLVTHCFPPAPPRALPYAYASEVPGVVEDARGFTYGMHVMAMDFEGCDVELRRQICRCLDHDPAKRPSLVWFEAVFLYNVRRPDLVERESDEQLRAHMNDIYGTPA